MSDNLNGRRKRGFASKKMYPEAEAMPMAGTRAFGERAAARKERLEQARKRGDLRIRTAYKTVRASTAYKRKMAAEAD